MLALMSIILAIALVGLVSILVLVWRKKPHLPYPPGPRPKPIIGNAFDLPSDMPWVKYLEWSKQLGSDILHMSAMGNHIVVLNKPGDIAELLEKRSSIYSTRPFLATTHLLGIDIVTFVRPYNNEWRKHRSLFHEGFKKEVMPRYHRTHTEKVHLFTDLLLRDPDHFTDHCKWLSTAFIMSTAFGSDIPVGKMNEYVELQERILTAVTQLSHPGGSLINTFPILRYLPAWLPGASTQRWAAEVKKLVTISTNQPFNDAKKILMNPAGTLKESVLARLVQDRLADNGTIRDERELKDVMGTVYIAGAEPMQATQLFFLLAMVLYPSVQARAQAELDKVIGTDRLPTYEDRSSLPYIDAILRETLRWRPVVPLAFPHATVKDDVYKGFYIPKGTLILPNRWAISQDETIYEKPETFNPDRFLNLDRTLKDGQAGFVFGYGRRNCPGKHIASDVLWMTIASVLATLNISKAKDENGEDIEVDTNVVSSGLTCFPQPFKCSIVPRSLHAETLIRSAAISAEGSMKG